MSIVDITCGTLLAGSVIVTNDVICGNAILVHKIRNKFAKVTNLCLGEVTARIHNLNVDRVRVGDTICTMTIANSPSIITLRRIVIFPDTVVIYEIVSRCAAVTTSKILAVVDSRCGSGSVVNYDIANACAAIGTVIGTVILINLHIKSPYSSSVSRRTSPTSPPRISRISSSEKFSAIFQVLLSNTKKEKTQIAFSPFDLIYFTLQ